MFTDRFIQLPIKTYDKRHKELTGENIDEDSFIKILPFEISSYRPSYDSDDLEQNEVVQIEKKNGETVLIYLTMDEFEAKLNAFTNQTT